MTEARLPPLTPKQSLELLIRNDARNVDDLTRSPMRRLDLLAMCIADCAQHMLDARKICRELEREAEDNLRTALAAYRGAR